MTEKIEQLRQVWKDAFGDNDDFLDIFFSTAYGPERCLYEMADGKIVSGTYWFDCRVGERKIAYIYALGTLLTYRNRGLGRKLMDRVAQTLKQRDYSGVLLVPGEPSLYGLYETMGYRTCTALREFTCLPAEQGTRLERLDTAAYAEARRRYLPENGVIQEGENLRFLEKTAEFYRGEDFLLAASWEGTQLRGLELLGNASAAPAILKSLDCQSGTFRTVGTGRDFAMYLPLDEAPAPSWFGLAFD